MGTFTLSQSRDSESVYIYPNEQVCMEWYADLPFGSYNYQLINNDKDDSTANYSFVWNDTGNARLDLYGLPDQSLSGTINYVQVFARARSYVNPQAASGVFYLAVNTDSVCSHAYYSNDIDLTTAYQLYSNIWITNPDTGIAWTWDDIDNLNIGIESTSPTYTEAVNATFRPTANGTIFQLLDPDCNIITDPGCHYKCVNHSSCCEGVGCGEPDWVTYKLPVSGVTDGDYPNRWRCNTYELANHTSESGPINSVTLFSQHSCIYNGVDNSTASHVFYTHSTRYDYSIGELIDTNYFPFGCGMNLKATTLTTNPNTSAAWTWTEIDDLEVGSNIQNWTDNDEGSWTDSNYIWTAQYQQIYLVVNYNSELNPPIEVCQCYARINYNPDDYECILNKPEQVSTNHTRNVKMFNFWNGSREVYDYNRSDKSLVLTGREYYCASTCTNPCERILCVRDMTRSGEVVTIAGLNPDYFNGVYQIKEFAWKQISSKPEHYEWMIYLEDSEE